MEIRKRKPLSDITNTSNLIPTSTLRKLVTASSNSNSTSQPPISVLKSVSSSTNQKLCSESSNSSGASIGSSNVKAARNSRTLKSSIASNGFVGNKNTATGNKRESIEKSKREREAADLILRSSPVERKDKGKAIVEPCIFSRSKTVKDNHIRICSSFNPLDQDLHREFTEKPMKEREVADLIVQSAPVERTNDKGKAIAEQYNSSPSNTAKDDQIRIYSTFNPPDQDLQREFTENSKIEREATDLIIRQVNAEKSKDKGKAIAEHYISSPPETVKHNQIRIHNPFNLLDGEMQRDEANHGNFSGGLTETTQESGKQEGTGEDIAGKEFVTPSSSLIEKRKGKERVPNPFGSLPETVRDEGEIKCLPPKRNDKKGKTGAGTFSCPAMTRTKNTLDDLDEIGDIKSSSSLTDSCPKRRKRRCFKVENTGELPLDFVEQQKTYFKEIDEFELVEEEASENELE